MLMKHKMNEGTLIFQSNHKIYIHELPESSSFMWEVTHWLEIGFSSHLKKELDSESSWIYILWLDWKIKCPLIHFMFHSQYFDVKSFTDS
jgi:hypothetical protein